MGVLSGKDLLSSKYLTAIVIDGSNRAWFIPVKIHVGDYFIAVINNQKYVFSLEGTKLTYQDTLVKSFQFMIYSIKHYKPINPDNLSLLELVTIANDLPKQNMMLHSILQIFSRQEKKDFKPHKIEDLKKYVEEQKTDPENANNNEFVEESQNIINYLEHLKISQIVTPIKQITEYIEDDLITTDPKWPGGVIDAVLAAEVENKRINNVPIKSNKAWMKIALVFSLIGIIGAVIYIAYDAGAFDGITGPLEGFSEFDFNVGGGTAPADIMEKYKTPEALKAAIDRGEVNYNSLPADVKKLVDSAPTPTAEP